MKNVCILKLLLSSMMTCFGLHSNCACFVTSLLLFHVLFVPKNSRIQKPTKNAWVETLIHGTLLKFVWYIFLCAALLQKVVLYRQIWYRINDMCVLKQFLGADELSEVKVWEVTFISSNTQKYSRLWTLIVQSKRQHLQLFTTLNPLK